MKRVPLIAGNWKMNKTAHEAFEFIQELAPLIASVERRVYLAPSFTALAAAASAAKGTKIQIGAQNMHELPEGPYTGEVSAHMLLATGATFVLLGHSERRLYAQETNGKINLKIKRAFAGGLVPILCIGETLQEREQGKTREVVCRQIEECLQDILAPSLASMMIAYEPVWAIGTGAAATPAHAQQVHRYCRDFVEDKWGRQSSQELYLLYGGSVNAQNIGSLMSEVDIDGVLVGNASLDVKTFAQLIHY
ncbi:MAG: triose-phosphate isomerase [Rhabdochlamydiaceae bacterium]|nr:triose-phosphate isomerase [Rhabdochlamydiaceae bacterium]